MKRPLLSKGSTFGLLLAGTSAITTGSFGVFLNYFSSLGISNDALSTLTPMAVLSAYLIYTLITQPKILKLPRKRFYLTLIVCSGLIFSPLYVYTSVRSMNTLPIAVASLLDFSHAVVLVFLMRIFFKTPITKKKILACIFAFTGMVLVLNVFGDSSGNITSIGIFWGLSNCISLAIAYCFDYYHISSGVSFLTCLIYTNTMSLILFSTQATPLQVIHEFSAAAATGGTTMLFMLVVYVVILIISNGTMAASYKYIDASTSSLAFVLEPTTATLLGFFVLHQHIQFTQIIGIIVAVIAIVYLQYQDSREPCALHQNE